MLPDSPFAGAVIDTSPSSLPLPAERTRPTPPARNQVAQRRRWIMPLPAQYATTPVAELPDPDPRELGAPTDRLKVVPNHYTTQSSILYQTTALNYNRDLSDAIGPIAAT